jgi:hypothetical protein
VQIEQNIMAETTFGRTVVAILWLLLRPPRWAPATGSVRP